MNAVVEVKDPQLPAPVARRGISEAQWRTLANNLFPGADSNSVLMVWDYCVARKLDPLKKPCHIVPMRVKDSKSGDYVWRDVVMPGIYEYRTTATRTGLYLGHAKPEYGPIEEYLGVKAPAYCDFTVYRWNPEAKMRAEYPVQIKFAEVAATVKDKKTGELYVNERWSKAPQQMLTKCAEAAALREAFPDELGGTHTADEMDGQVIEAVVVDGKSKRIDPRGDLSEVEDDSVLEHYSAICELLNQDKEEAEIALDCREYVAEHLQKFNELYICVLDKLAKNKGEVDGRITGISKGKWRELLNVGLDRGDTHTA
jgi:phage recombination protein Bet